MHLRRKILLFYECFFLGQKWGFFKFRLDLKMVIVLIAFPWHDENNENKVKRLSYRAFLEYFSVWIFLRTNRFSFKIGSPAEKISHYLIKISRYAHK